MKYMQCQFTRPETREVITIGNIIKLLIKETRVEISYLNTDLTPGRSKFAIPRNVKDFTVKLSKELK